MNHPKFSSDHPNKAMECYPCGCPSCEGYHECDFIHKKLEYGVTNECDVCGKRMQYMPMTEEDIDQFVSNFSSIERRKQIKDNMMKNIDICGQYITLTPASR